MTLLGQINAAGIDGSREHWVVVHADRDSQPILELNTTNNYRANVVKNLRKRATALGFTLVENSALNLT